MMDQVLGTWVSLLIEISKLAWMLGYGRPWVPGTPLRLLFAGYNGTRNTGSDVRVQEMLRQVRRILGDEKVHLSVMTQNFELSRGYFDNATQVHLPDLFPLFLFREVSRHNGVMACEGSMFKSKFANALTTMMIGSLGMASAQNRLSVGYGAEAGYMDPLLVRMCRRYCRESLIITRNEESRVRLRDLGIPTELGTDTAWTFEPHGPEYGQQLLREVGWDGVLPVLVICPINPFWWPVRASVAKAVSCVLTGAFRESRYRSIYFHNSGPEVKAAYQRYLVAISNAVEIFRKEHRVFPVLVAMEQLDTDACQRIAERLGGAPVFPSYRYDMFQLVSVLRCGHLMVSSRYHGIVTSMPGLVPSAGVTMDERIRNLMRERGHEHLLLEVDDAHLQDKLVDAMNGLLREGEAIRDSIGRTVVKNLKLMARMGTYLEEHVQRCYPEFPIRSGLLSWEDYLAPLSPSLRRVLETYGE
ncbi:MAG: polysaccharide pyruvyl transferase family protein [Acidobacteria bacterium]|nr:polysaccharide pyruvyl transferase family protein [Acidobacteriota bacterium]